MVVIFDLDGTIIDSYPGISSGLRETFKNFGVDGFDSLDYNQFIGPPLMESLKAVFDDEDEIVEAIEEFRKYYDVKGQYELVAYENIEEVFKELAPKHKLLVATSKPQKRARDILGRLGYSKYFHYIAGAVEGEHKKELIIRDALSHLDFDEDEEIYMVGDRFSDIVGAKGAGVPSIGVLYGYGTREELEHYGADHIVETVIDLKEFFKNK